MAQKLVKDERLQLIYYKAGYYAFLVSFPLMCLTILLFIGDTTHDSVFASIAALVTFWSGLGVFAGYLWKHKASEAEKELLWRSPDFVKRRKIALLVIGPVFIIVNAITEYMITIYLDQDVYTLVSELPRYVISAVIVTVVFYFSNFRKPKQSGAPEDEQ